MEFAFRLSIFSLSLFYPFFFLFFPIIDSLKKDDPGIDFVIFHVATCKRRDVLRHPSFAAYSYLTLGKKSVGLAFKFSTDTLSFLSQSVTLALR